MDEYKKLVILKGEDKTKEIQRLEIKDTKIIIQFETDQKEYPYKKENVIIRDSIQQMCYEGKDVYYKNQLLFNIDKIINFKDIIKVFYISDSTDIFPVSDISFRESTKNNVNKNVIQYFRSITQYVKSGNEEREDRNAKENFLEKEYKKLNYIPEQSVLSSYINKKELTPLKEVPTNIIYPFRFNMSQKQAVENVYKRNISIIEGPPGTGKTQTILNIIANLAIMQNKTVAVVSNNNEAVKNVKDKLEKNGYGFLVADLGRKDKRKAFFENISQPQVQNFNISEKEQDLLQRLKVLNQKLDKLLEKNNKKAELEKEIEDYTIEQQHFNTYYQEQKIEEIGKLSFYRQTEDKILGFMLDTQVMQEQQKQHHLIDKITLFFKYGIKDFKSLDEHFMDYILELQGTFYEIKIKNLKKEKVQIEQELEQYDFKELQKEHQEVSEKIFKNRLYQKYHQKENKFDIKTYKKNMEQFVKSFPVILSTTFSLRNSVSSHFLFDYLIMDESSQVDLLAGSLALSCAKNAIIVGDTKQLPQIVDQKIKQKIEDNQIEECHDYFQNSILSAILKTYDERVLPRIVLKEHYRCHPKIIEFCNKRYYHNELIAFATKEHLEVEKPLILYYTSEGNHMRKITKGEKTGTYNQREVDVIIQEVLTDQRVGKYKEEQIGIATPYRLQADNITNCMKNEIESDTIHKYQGREKELMILSTVIDSSWLGKIGVSFVDDPCMINVAISRAINQFVLVTDHKLFNEKGEEIKALLKYIKYNTLDSEVVQSQLVSVFDLLYKEYSKKLDKLNNRLLYRSYYKSENIIDTILDSELQKEEYRDYEYVREEYIRNTLRKLEDLTKEERTYINNGARVDFVIYDKMDKKPKLWIEVDGIAYHKNNPKQSQKDKLKDSIAKKAGIQMIRYQTDGTYTEQDIATDLRKKCLLDE